MDARVPSPGTPPDAVRFPPAAPAAFPSAAAVAALAAGHQPDPGASMSLHAAAYTDPRWFDVEQAHVVAGSWQWWCHAEALRTPGSYLAGTVAGMPIVAVRGHDARLRAFYNVCRHRAHELVSGAGTLRSLVCPYHAWTYDLHGHLTSARHTGDLVGFDPSEICLTEVQVEELAGFVFVHLDPHAAPLSEQAAGLADEITHWAPDIASLTFAHRLTYEIEANWKNVVDNFLECYHCHVAHKDFVSLVDMDTYRVTTHGIWSSHMARAGTTTNTAYDTAAATVTDHAVWWLWPNTCVLRYPGRGNVMVLKIVPVGPDRTLETFDLFLEAPEPDDAERATIRYLDEVLQVEDIALVESVQRGMRTPAFTQGRIVADRSGSGLSEHALHHFHGLLLDAYRGAAGG